VTYAYTEPGETVWGGVEPLSVKERMAGDQTAAKGTHRLVMRYTSELTQSSQIGFGSRTFEVAEILNRDERNRELSVLCTEKM
jgi:SPP1 family predicted phage head-tail adaptor